MGVGVGVSVAVAVGDGVGVSVGVGVGVRVSVGVGVGVGVSVGVGVGLGGDSTTRSWLICPQRSVAAVALTQAPSPPVQQIASQSPLLSLPKAPNRSPACAAAIAGKFKPGPRLSGA